MNKGRAVGIMWGKFLNSQAAIMAFLKISNKGLDWMLDCLGILPHNPVFFSLKASLGKR